MKVFHIHITGLVQGVGFRPFVYRIAREMGLDGTVDNRNDGVHIYLMSSADPGRFVESIKQQAPPASEIRNISIASVDSDISYEGFTITGSRESGSAVTRISPDIAVCEDCLEDMMSQPHRLNYPLINCTNCGPRFTIIRDLPYDRDKTTMDVFEMCDRCRAEYHNPNDRRFHAQPVACNHCGPTYSMAEPKGLHINYNEILNQCSRLLHQGEVLAVKGMGGYFLCCDASNPEAVKLLRSRKKRDAKPFAVMFRDEDTLKQYCELTEDERLLIASWKRPVVLLRQHTSLAAGINPGLGRLGAMLPCLPFHYHLFESCGLPALVMTSGNISEDPIIIDDSQAVSRLLPLTAGVVSHNREIFNRCDDSVVMMAGKHTILIRRSRGYVPNPVIMPLKVDGLLATGAELKNCFAIGLGDQAILSQHIGDLKNMETFGFFTESVERFKRMFRFSPNILACDLHPDYLSGRYAAQTGLPLIKVQHHHAHIAACMAENSLEGDVCGVSLDGVGLGTDGAVWGGEFIICNYQDFRRFSHFDYVPLPGGDPASREPWRMAVSYLFRAMGEEMFNLPLSLFTQIPENKIRLLIHGIQAGINCPQTSSCGRLFDAVAAITGICTQQVYEAQAPMMLEDIATKQSMPPYSIQAGSTLSFLPMICEIAADVREGIPASQISSRFHSTIIQAIGLTVKEMTKASGLKRVVLSGGSFQNTILLQSTAELLEKEGLQVFTHKNVPANDGGIAIGQLAVAAARLKAE